MRYLLILGILLCALWPAPAHAVAAYNATGSCGSANATSCMPTATKLGDLGIAFAVRSGNVTPPSCPATWTCPAGWAGSGGTSTTSISWRGGCKLFFTTNDTSGVWTNAGNVVLESYTGSKVGAVAGCNNSVGGTSFTSAASGTLTFTTITMTVGTGTSLVIGFGGSRTATNVNQAPTGMMNRDSSGTTVMVSSNDTNGGVASWATQTISINASTRNIGAVFEILAAPASVANCKNTDQSGTTFFSIGCETDVAAGDDLFVACRFSGTSVTSVTDIAGTNTYTTGASSTGAAGIGSLKTFYVSNAAAKSSNQVWCNYTTAVAFTSIIVYDVSGYANGLDLSPVATDCTSGCSQTITSAGFNTSNANDIIIACATWNFASAQTWTLGNIAGAAANTLVTSSGTNGDTACEQKAVAATQTGATAGIVVAGATLTASYIHVISFKQTAAGTCVPGLGLALVGVAWCR